jgi:hypothetical protein
MIGPESVPRGWDVLDPDASPPIGVLAKAVAQR